MRRFGHQGKADANTAGIVEDLRALSDVSVRFIGKPVDLIVGYRGATFLIEIKNKDGLDLRGKSWQKQKKFIEEWRGSCVVCHDYAEVLAAISYRGA